MERFAKVDYEGNVKWCKLIAEEYYELYGSIYDEDPTVRNQPLDCSKVRLLPPCDGNKILGLAYNYKGLVGEKNDYDEPLFFFKSQTGLVGHEGNVIYPDYAKKVWHEVELAIVIRTQGKNIPIKEAGNYILGYTCGNDITCENILNRDWHLARSKGLDTFCPLGPFLVRGVKTENLRLRSYINGRVTQESYTSDRIINDAETVALISRYVTLYPGDVIMTGTPEGAVDAVISPGDIIKVEIENIGVLVNHVISDKEGKR